jgi:hypothetical protein
MFFTTWNFFQNDTFEITLFLKFQVFLPERLAGLVFVYIFNAAQELAIYL